MATASGEASIPTQALQVLEFTDFSEFELDEDVLERILLDRRVRDRKVMIVSVLGAMGLGNSFLLNIFLKYLKNLGKPDWMDNPDVPLEGFEWGNNFFRTTEGIHLWSEPFFIKTPSGEEVCVLLMDTRSFYQLWSPHPEFDMMLTLNSLLASAQFFSPYRWIYLVNQFKYVINYGKLASEVYKTKPFQTLYVLVRNWINVGEHPFGFEGGEGLWKKVLKAAKIDFPQCFKDTHCYIMPGPGGYFHTANFHGYLSDKGINPEFKTSLKTLTEHVFDPKNIVIKEINGKQITGRELFQYFRSYIKVFQGNLPEPSDLIEATDEARNMIVEAEDAYFSKPLGLMATDEEWNVIAIDKAEDLYRMKMREVYNVEMSHLNRQILDTHHNECYVLAMRKFRRFGVVNQIFEDKLRHKLLEIYDDYRKDIEATDEEWNVIAIDKAEDLYRMKMREVYNVEMSHLNRQILDTHHNECYVLAMRKFRRFGVVNQIFEDKLRHKLLEIYDDYRKDIEAKEEEWNMIAIDKAEDLYRMKMREVYNVEMSHLNRQILDTHHNECYKLAMKKFRRFGVVKQILEDKLRDKLLEIYDDYRKDIECFEADLNSISLLSANVNGKSTVSENKKNQ